ncbi:selT/selW/selH selenoprotein domain-containing protein [Spizellomyces punctatus DAOM BR117]|uniref:SelT/selW/selH selenoprotein domain-containing protein n=1 Tax=Spizellomyces punctatus (strain DAOM BR117) TaxID=645134 RepID=A0A0L0HB74_SPIPD|nr:selT/selW/selH selenoprotein domain-containing protein [Spizellomyces punctatus DAOM BR117]KNC98119.1 selT/selW/selH selenoprotein domain-containing protein [Spizellomyces punctatus DAOM BR117]|eukprot:XP_016606159.1 selT/selW/selH selenoprotein domain-containing protein [Spizellomyces punctatus DAOM BR117]
MAEAVSTLAPGDSSPSQIIRTPRIEIEYCPGCRWMLRAAWMAQELLTTFTEAVGEVALIPGNNAIYQIRIVVNDQVHLVWDRKTNGGFPEIKDLKQKVRDLIAPDMSLGHSDAKSSK